MRLNHPVEIDGVTHNRLTVSSLDAIANFKSANPERVILSLARVFDVPRRVIRHLHADDAQRAGDLIVGILDNTTRSMHFE